MKKVLLATAVGMAMAGLTACDQGGASTESGLTTGGSQVQAQSASASFAVRFPEPEVSAALINANAASIELKMLPLASLVVALEQCLETGSYPMYCAGNIESPVPTEEQYYYNLWQVTEQLKDHVEVYADLDSSKLTENKAREFGRDVAGAMKFLIDNDVMSKLSLNGMLIEETLTRTAPSVTVGKLFAGAYVIMADQRTAENERIAYETMTAFLGEGRNPITLNMMSGTWRSVNTSNQPVTIPLNLFGSNLAAEWDWDIESEGNQNVVELISGGENTSAALTTIHYLNHGKPMVDPEQPSYYAPVNTLLDFRVNGSEDIVVRETTSNYMQDYAQSQQEYNEAYFEINGAFYQIYDARLAGTKTFQGGMFEMDIGWYSEGQEMGAGAFILDERADDDEEYQSQNQYSWVYQKPDGSSATLYYVNQYNAKMAWQMPSDQADITKLEPMTVTAGNRIDGVVVEYISRVVGESDSGTTAADIDKYKPTAAPTQAVMALAMDKIARKEGFVASAAAAHPLGSQCVAIDEMQTNTDINYGWIDGKWQAGTVNWTYSAKDGVIKGVDMNKNGTVEPFETGVVQNYGRDAGTCIGCDEQPLRYRIYQRTENGLTTSYQYAYAYISAEELAADWNQLLDQNEKPLLGQYESKTTSGLKIALELKGEYIDSQYVLSEYQYRVSDLDNDGDIEFYEQVGALSRQQNMEMHVCYQSVSFSGSTLGKTLDDFLYNMEETVDLTGKTASSVITTSLCDPQVKGGWEYSFTATQMTMKGSDSFDSSGGYDACILGGEETLVETMTELTPDFDIPFNCQSYPICTFDELNNSRYGYDEDQRWYQSDYQYDSATQVLTYTKTVQNPQQISWTEVITLNSGE